MTIAEIIELVCTNVQGNYSFILEDWYSADEALNHVKLPAFILLPPTGGTIERHNGRFWHTQNVALAIVKRVMRDADGRENMRVVDGEVYIASSIIEGIMRTGLVEEISDVAYSTIYEQTSDIVSGILLTFSARVMYGCVHVPPIPIPDEEDE